MNMKYKYGITVSIEGTGKIMMEKYTNSPEEDMKCIQNALPKTREEKAVFAAEAGSKFVYINVYELTVRDDGKSDYVRIEHMPYSLFS